MCWDKMCKEKGGLKKGKIKKMRLVRYTTQKEKKWSTTDKKGIQMLELAIDLGDRELKVYPKNRLKDKQNY